MIGDSIEVSILAIAGEKVRIGIEAPRSVPVYRREVYEEMQAEGGKAPAEASSSDSSGPSGDAG